MLQFEKNGYIVLDDFFKPEEIDELKFCGEEFTKNLPPETERKIFNTIDAQQVKRKKENKKEDYFFMFLIILSRICV